MPKYLLTFILWGVLSCSAIAAPILTVTPQTLVANNTVAGWGFTLMNDTSSFLSVDSVQLFSLVDAPLFRFGTAANFTELFATYQFNSPTILIAPNSTYTLAYNGADQGLATWDFPNGFGTYGNLASNLFQIQATYSLYADNAYGTPTLSGGVPVTGNLLADARLQFAGTSSVPEPASWILVAPAVLLFLRKARR